MAPSPLADTTEMPTIVPADVNSPASSYDNELVSRSEVAATAVESSTKPVLRRSSDSEMAPSPLPDKTEMPTAVPADVNPPASSHDNARVGRPEVGSTAVESSTKPGQRRSFSEIAPSPLPDTTEMPTTVPANVNSPASSHDNSPVSRPEFSPTAVESSTKPGQRRSFSEMSQSPLPDTTEMPPTMRGDINPPASSHDNAPVSRPEVVSTAAGSPPKPVLRRSQRQRRSPKHLNDYVLAKP